MRGRTISIAGATVVVAGAGLAGTVMLGTELAVCYIPTIGILDQAQLCGPDVWGHTAVPFLLLVISVALVVMWLVAGFGTGVQQIWRAATFRRRLLTAAIDHPVASRGRHVGLPVVVTDLDVLVTLTIGIFRPKIVISTATINTLDDHELEAVLQHEASHVRRRDPATYAIVRGSVNALLFLPAVRGWAERTILDAEIAADAAAIRSVGRQPLLRALARLDAADEQFARAAVGSIDGMMSDRIRVLAGRTLDAPVSGRDLVRSLLGVGVVLLPLAGLITAISRTQ